MKKIMTIIGVFILFAFASCGGFWNFGVNYTYDNAEKYTMGSGRIADSVQNLEIDWICGKVNVVYHDKDTVDFSEECGESLTDEKTMYYLFENATLSIQFAKSGSFDWNPPEKDLTVFLPRNVVLENFKVDTVSADVTAENLSVKKSDINTVSGAVKVIAEEVTKFNCDSTSGNITLSAKIAPSSIDIDSVSGRVALYLPKDLSATLEFDTVSGDFQSEISCSANGKDTFSFGAGKNEYSVDTTSGDLKIEEYTKGKGHGDE